MVNIWRKVMELVKRRKSFIGVRLEAKGAETARPDCTLLIYIKTSQTRKTRIAPNDIDYRSAA
jgi:hypothetical protein